MKSEERWEDVQRIFEEARKLAEEKRRSYLDQACDGDADLRREVQSILDAYQAADDSFIQPPGNEDTPEQIGPYKILGVVGEGGHEWSVAAMRGAPAPRRARSRRTP